MPVLRPVDVRGGGTEYVHAALGELDGKVIRYLPSHGDDHSLRGLEPDDVHDPFERQFVEIQPVAHVVVRGDGLGIVIDHYTPPALPADLLHAGYGTPVELDGTADVVFAGSKHYDGTSVILVWNFVLRSIISEIQIIGLVRGGSGKGVDTFDHRDYAESEPLLPDLVLTCLRNRIFIQGDGYLAVGESLLLGLAEKAFRQGRCIAERDQFIPGPDYVGELVEEPFVDLGQFVDAVYGPTKHHGLGYVEDTGVGGIGEGVGQVLHFVGLVAHEAVGPLAYHPEALLDGLLEGEAYGHHLADRLHACADLAGHSVELAEIPTRDLAHDILHVRLVECALGAACILDLGQFIAETYLGGDECEGITCGLGGQG